MQELARAKTCVACGLRIMNQGDVSFPCPKCGTPLGRCLTCRDQGVTYRCSSSECDWAGP